MTKISLTRNQTRFFNLTNSVKTMNSFVSFFVLCIAFISCGFGRPNFEGTWKSESGIKFVITKVNDDSYDVKAYGPNENVGDNVNNGNPIDGTFTYNSKDKSIMKATDGIGLQGYEITYSDGKLYLGGDKGGQFFIKQ